MSLLTICQALAVNVGLRVPDVVATSAERTWAEAIRMASEAGQELARRVDWGALQSSTTLTGTGAQSAFAMPADFDRLRMGATVTVAGAVVRPLSQQEFQTLPASVGTPRYFNLDGATLNLWPTPSDTLAIVALYQSKNWISGKAAFTDDADVSLIDEAILEKGLFVRWRRQKGMPYADEEAEYEAALADRASFDDRARF